MGNIESWCPSSRMGVSIEALTAVVYCGIMALISLHRKNDKRGGYLTISDNETGTPILHLAIGKIDPGEAMKYHIYSLEKAKRLHDHKGHASSWQTRDPEKGQYGGAIRTQKYILSFSGLPELADEALMLYLASFYGFSEPDELYFVSRCSKNPFFKKMVRRIN